MPDEAREMGVLVDWAEFDLGQLLNRSCVRVPRLRALARIWGS